jgi:hypothetical protein
LHGIIFSLFSVLITAINSEYRYAKFVRSMFVEHEGSDGTPQMKKKIQTSFCDKMGQFKVVSCFRKKTKTNEQLDIGAEKLENLLDIFGMFKTVQKLKVIVSLLVP